MTKLTINVGSEVTKVISDAKAGGISVTELVRRAISIWAYIREQEAAGYTFGMISPKDETIREVKFP